MTLLLLLSACGRTPEVTEVPVPIVEVRTVEIQRPAPIIPPVDQLNLRTISWVIITPDNIDEKFAQIQSGDIVLFGLTADDYENLSLNISDLRALIEQQQSIIGVYQSQFE